MFLIYESISGKLSALVSSLVSGIIYVVASEADDFGFAAGDRNTSNIHFSIRRKRPYGHHAPGH